MREKENYRVLREGDRLKLDGLDLDVIWPPKGELTGSFNRDSLVMILTYKKFKCLLAADINSDAENELLKKGVVLKADILKVAHHGANDATSEAFLKKVQPKIAVISIDENNLRGYPAREVLERLRANNIKTFRTDKNGTVIITVDKNSEFSIATEN
jgi:competence protein ComEC